MLDAFATRLQMTNLSCSRNGHILFKNVSCSLNAGQLLELRGPNGSGKTTLLRCMASATSDYSGQVEMQPSDFMLLSHKLGLSDGLTVMANLRWYCGLRGCNSRVSKLTNLEQALTRVGLSDYRDTLVVNLSAGQKKRLALARFVLQPAVFWLLDEPFAALDADGIQLATNLCSQHLQAGGVVVLSTHIELDIDCDRKTLSLQ